MISSTRSRTRLDLSGPWQLAFDLDREGVRTGWTEGAWSEEEADLVQVPALWNITHPDVDGVGFYRKVFTIPADWQGKVVHLYFGGASYRAEAWLNGKYLGSHEGAYTPFSFDVTASARMGAENQLVVRVAGPSKTCDVDGMKIGEIPVSKQSWYYTHGGLWGEVFLESRPLLACQSVHVEPDLRREMVLVEVTVGNSHHESRPTEVQLQIAKPDGSLAAEQRTQMVIPPGSVQLTYRIHLPRPFLWSCETPNLYQLQVEVAESGQEIDSRTISFGMREFTVHKGQFLLNGKPIFLRGLLLQPDYPITLVTPPTHEMMVREISLAKEAGFNLIRVHLRPAPPGYLDLADRMGMLIYAESSLAWIKESPRLLDHARRELRAMIERDRNHPSVVFWGIHNENRAASALTSDALIRLARSLDPTRVIVDNSGGSLAIDQDFGWVDHTTVVPDRETGRQTLQDIHVYIGAPISPPVYEWLRTLGISDLPLDMAAHDFGSRTILDAWNHDLQAYDGKIFVSELGCGGMADLDEVMAGYRNREHLRDAREMKAFRDSLYQGFAARHLDRIFGSVQNLIQATQALQAAGLARQVEALLVNPRVSGYLVTQLNDVAWEFHAGILDHWRNPKPVYHVLKRLNQPHCVILKAASPVVACDGRVEVTLTLVNQTALPGMAELHVAVHDPTGLMIETSIHSASSAIGIHEVATISLRTSDISGKYRVSARLVEAQETLAESVEVILALPPVNLTQMAPNVELIRDVPDAFSASQSLAGQNSAIINGAQAERIEDPAQVLLVASPASLTEIEWNYLLDRVESGRVAVVGPLHKRDELCLRVLHERGVNLQLHYGIGNWMGCYHWLSDSELFAGLPTEAFGVRVAGEAFVDVLPRYVMSELGGDVHAGSIRNTQTRREAPTILWYSDVEALRLGSGALFFCQYRIFEHAHGNPLAARLAHNLIRLAHGYLAHPAMRSDEGKAN